MNFNPLPLTFTWLTLLQWCHVIFGQSCLLQTLSATGKGTSHRGTCTSFSHDVFRSYVDLNHYVRLIRCVLFICLHPSYLFLLKRQLVIHPQGESSESIGFIIIFLHYKPDSDDASETEDILFRLTLESQKQGQESIKNGTAWSHYLAQSENWILEFGCVDVVQQSLIYQEHFASFHHSVSDEGGTLG